MVVMTRTRTAQYIRAIMNALDLNGIANHFYQQNEDDEDSQPIVVCDGVSVDAFNEFVGDGEDLAMGLRFLELSADGRILVIDFPSRVHEVTVNKFQLDFLIASGNVDENCSIWLPDGTLSQKSGQGGRCNFRTILRYAQPHLSG